MRRAYIFLLLLTVFCRFLFSNGNKDVGEKLIVYTYDSFSSEWGPGPAIAAAFLKETGIVIEFNAPGDAITTLNQLILEKDRSRADLVIGLDNGLLSRALDADILEPYESPLLDSLPPEYIFDESNRLIPYDYGHFAICYDSQLLQTSPASLEDLTSKDYAKSLVLMDPRTSTPGLGFLLWTIAAYGNRWLDYWERLKPSILTIANGWSQGYTLLVAGEASMALSYGTSPVYHVEYEESTRYKAAEFSDGHLMQIEGMGIVKGSNMREEAELLIDFMLGEFSQKTLAMKNIMLPVMKNVPLPTSFEAALRPSKTIPDPNANTEELQSIIDSWTEIFSR